VRFLVGEVPLYTRGGRCRASWHGIAKSGPEHGSGFSVVGVDILRVDLSGRGTARAEDAQGTPTQSHISPSILVYEEKVV